MNLSINDIRRKQFDKSFRGYDPTEVDLFLKQVADRLETIQDEERRANERVREAEAKLVHYEKVELALQEALESARETARRSEVSAEEKARLIVQEAELRAEKILHDAESERHGLRQDLVRLNSRQTEVAARLRGFLLSELEVLAQFQGDDPVGFIRLQAANPQGVLPSPQARLEAPIEAPDPEPEPTALPEPEAPVPAAPDTFESGTTVHRTDEPTASPMSPPAEAPTSAFESPLPSYAQAQAEAPPSAPPPAAPLPSDPTPYRVARHPLPEPIAPPQAEMPAEMPPSAVITPPPTPPPSLATPADPGPPTGAYASADETATPPPAAPQAFTPPEPEPVDAPPPARTGGWDLRSLVTGEERSVTASDEEHERIRRILDDLD